MLVVDPLKQEPAQIEELQKARDRIDKALAPLTTEEAKLLYENRAAVDIFSSQIYSDALGTSGDVLGYASEVGNGYYEEINKTLKDIQELYKATYNANGGIMSGQEFFGRREILFEKLSIILNRFSKSQLNLAEYEDIKKALGLSTSSIIHRWNQSGVADIEGYATYIEKSAKLISILKKVGYVGIGLDFASYSTNIYEACSKGREDSCKKAAITEYSKFGSKQLSAYAGGWITGKVTQGACMWVLGLATTEIGGIGSAACLITGVSAGLIGGKIIEEQGEKAGEYLGDSIIYEKLFK